MTQPSSDAVDLLQYHHRDSIVVAAPPDVVYAVVADVTRIGDLSPVCRSAEWLDDAHTRFRGTNVRKGREWTTECRVDAAEPPREFTFTNLGGEADLEMVRWSYTFGAVEGGTEVTEQWQVLPGYAEYVRRAAPDADLAGLMPGVVARTEANIAESLANLKAVVEG
jgi:hypothetical protein